MSGEYFEYYLYSEKPQIQDSKGGMPVNGSDYTRKQIRIAPDMFVMGSGVTNAGRKMVISHLQKVN